MVEQRSSRQARAIQRHDAILTAACHLMVNEGMKAVTHRRVADEAGVPTASIRYYFESREDLLLSCMGHLEHQRSEAASKVREIASSDLSNGEIGRLTVRCVWGIEDDALLIGAVASAMDAVRESQILADHSREWRERMDDDLKRLFALCGVTATDPAIALAIVNGSIVNSAVEGFPNAADSAAKAVARILERD